MNLSAFEDLLDRCGGDAADWPPGARAAADRLLAQSPEARRALSAQQSAEAWLRRTKVTAPLNLAERAMQSAQAATPRATILTPRMGWAAAAVAAITLGLAAGWGHGGAEDPSQTLALALYAPEKPPMPVDRRWIVAGLGCSLLLNLFLASVLIGRVLAPEGAPGAGALAPAARVRLLSPSEHAAFAKAMGPHRAAIRQARMAQRAARAIVEADIRADPFDRARLMTDLATLRQAQASQQAEVHAGLIDALGVLTPASRAALAARGFGQKPEAGSASPPARDGEPAR